MTGAMRFRSMLNRPACWSAITRGSFDRARRSRQPAQDRLAAINERLASLGTQFGQNVLADEKSFVMVLEESDLVGLTGVCTGGCACRRR